MVTGERGEKKGGCREHKNMEEDTREERWKMLIEQIYRLKGTRET